jgi:tetratricopeptide (TPR) repeat protein
MDQSQGTPPDPEQISDLDALVQSLHRLRVWSGNPSLRTLAKKAGPLLRPPRVLSHTTLAHLFQPDRRRLDMDLVLAVVRALGLDEGEVGRWRDAWFRVHAGAKSGASERAHRQLPADLAAFTGRDRELRAVVGVVDEVPGSGSTVVISAIDGMAGVGKSALAVRAAHFLSDRFPDGQLFLDLHGHTRGMSPRDPADALAALLKSLGVPPGRIPAEPDARAAAYRERLAGTRTLILLDNAASEAQVRPLIPGHGGCLVLITSRRRLKALDAAHTVALDVLPLPDAVALLRTLVEPGRAAAQDPAWQRVATLCGCLPLALRIATALIRHRPAWTLDHLADKLRAVPLDLGSFTDGARDLTAVFDLSYQALGNDLRDLLRRLGLTPGLDIDAYATAALLDTDPVRAERLLQDLVDHHLLTEPVTGRYRMHDLIRSYAHTLTLTLDPESERDRAFDRLLHYYAHTAQAASQTVARYPRLAPDGGAPAHAPTLTDPDVARSWLRVERANLDAAFSHSLTGGRYRPTLALAAGLAEILQSDGPWPRALEIHQAAADVAEHQGYPEAHANALTDLGRARHLTGDHAGAGDSFARALGIYRELGHRHGEAHALTDLGNVRRMTGDYPRAGEAFSRALDIYSELGNRHGEATALIDLGNMRQTIGDHPGAVEALTRALEICRALGHRLGEATALTDLGRARHLSGDYSEAADAHTRALEIYRALGNRHGEANTLTGLGSVRQTAGDHAGAGEALAQALEIFRALGHRGNEACVLNYYAATIAATGDRQRALALYQQSLAMNQELNKPDDEAIALEGIADHHLATGEAIQGATRLREALGIYRHLGMSADAERVETRLAELAQA